MKPFDFFYENGGYSWNPKTESKEDGRRRCAEALAEAEQKGNDAGLSFEWSIDPYCDSSDFSEEDPPWQLWDCLCRDIDGTVQARLGGIDFGRDGTPWDQPYRRIVEAELASEAL